MNTTSVDATESATEMPNPLPVDPLQFFIYVLTALTDLLILTLNPICLVVLRRARGIQETTKVFMASLTMSDFCIGLFWVLPELTAQFAGEWVLGEFLCSVWGVAASSFFNLSFLSLILLTIDRFVAIVYSLRYPTLMTLKMAKLIVTLTWTLNFAYCIGLFGIYAPNTLSTKAPRTCNYGMCDLCLYQSVFVMAISLGTVSILYIYILSVAQQQARRIAAQNQISISRNDQNPPQRVSTKSATTVFIITMGIFICWSPTISLFVLIPRSEEEPVILILMANLIFFTNSWLNVVIYYFRNRELRQALHGLASMCLRQQ